MQRFVIFWQLIICSEYPVDHFNQISSVVSIKLSSKACLMPGNVSYRKSCNHISLQSMILLLKMSSWKLYTLSQINDFAASNLCLALEENKSLKSLNLEVSIMFINSISSQYQMESNLSWCFRATRSALTHLPLFLNQLLRWALRKTNCCLSMYLLLHILLV